MGHGDVWGMVRICRVQKAADHYARQETRSRQRSIELENPRRVQMRKAHTKAGQTLAGGCGGKAGAVELRPDQPTVAARRLVARLPEDGGEGLPSRVDYFWSEGCRVGSGRPKQGRQDGDG